MQREKLKISVQNFKKNLCFAFCLLSFAFLLYGCGYTLQTKANLPFDAVAIGRIENRTFEPKLQDRFNSELAETLMEYGFALNPSAQFRIEGDITGFELIILSEKNLTASEYQVTIKGSFRLVDTATAIATPLHSDSPFVTYFRSESGFESVLAQKELATNKALKDIAEELTRRILYKKAYPAAQPADAQQQKTR